MNVPSLRIILLLCCFLGFHLSGQSWAVDLEYRGAGESVGMTVNTLVGTHGGPPPEENGISYIQPDDAEVNAYSTAVTIPNDDPDVESLAFGKIETDILLDSPTASIRATTSIFDVGEVSKGVARGSSNLSDRYFGGSLDAYSSLGGASSEDWTIDVLPSAGEAPGTPARIRVDAVFEGVLSVTGDGAALANWFVGVDGTGVTSGLESITAGIFPFVNAGSYEFLVPLGSSFQLHYFWHSAVSGDGISSARGEFTEASIVISARLVPEPASLTLLALGLCGLLAGSAHSCRRASIGSRLAARAAG